MPLDPGLITGLTNQVTGGTLQFVPGDALKSAKAATDLYDDLLGMADAVGQVGINDLAPFGTLNSGRELATVFSKKATRLSTVLNEHAEIVREIGDLFVAAGKAYENAETDSSDTFKSLGELTFPDEPQSYKPSTDGTDLGDGSPSWGRIWDDIDTTEFPSTIKDFPNKDPGSVVTVEAKDSVTFKEMYDLGQAIQAQPVMDASATWKSFGNDLDTKLSVFVDDIAALNRSWVGSGAQGAADAVTSYQEDMGPLFTSIVQVSKLLEYTANWLHYTKQVMPPDMDSKSGCDDLTDNYRDALEKTYLTGMKNTAESMPLLDGPVTKDAGSGKGGDSGTDTGSGSGDGSGSDTDTGSGSGDGSGTDTQTESGGGSGDGSDTSSDYQDGYDDGYEQGYEDAQNEQGESGSGDGAGAGSDSGPGGSSGSGGPTGGGVGSGSGGSGSSGLGGSRAGLGSGGPGTSPSSIPNLSAGQSSPTGASGKSGGGGPRGGGGTGSQIPSIPEMPSAEDFMGDSSGSGLGGNSSSLGPGQSGYGPSGGGLGGSGSFGGSTEHGSPGGGSGASGGGKMPKNPTAADVLSKLTGIPESQLPESLKNRKITASDGSGDPSLADALSELTGIPLDEMPEELKNTPLSSLYDENSPYGSAKTLFGKDSSAGDLLESVTGEGGAGSGRDSGDSSTGTGGSSAAGQDPLGILSTLLTQGIQAFTQFGDGLPGMEELARMLDPAQLQQHVQGMLDPAREQLDQLAGALGGGGAGAGVPAGSVTPPLAPYPEPQSSQLFPRAALAGPGMDTAGGYQSPTGSSHPMGGAPMGGAPGAGAGSAGGQNNDYKPAKYLQGRENLDEAWDVPDRVKPVIEP